MTAVIIYCDGRENGPRHERCPIARYDGPYRVGNRESIWNLLGLGSNTTRSSPCPNLSGGHRRRRRTKIREAESSAVTQAVSLSV